MILYSHKTKYTALVAQQAALSARICSGSTWELAANLTINRVDPTSCLSLRQILLSIPSQTFQSTPLFNTVDRTWRSTNGVTFTFHPENEADARSYIVGLIPYLNDSINNPCSLKQFSKEARLWHVTSKWDPETRQAYTAKEAELDNFLDDDDELNLTDEILSYRPTKTPDIEINVQRVADPENMLPM
jgi:hypothetical protein